MVGLFRKTTSEPELGDRIAGLTRRRGILPVAPADAEAGEASTEVPAHSVPEAASTTVNGAPPPSDTVPSVVERQVAALAARPLPARPEPAAEPRPEAPTFQVAPRPQLVGAPASDTGSDKPRLALSPRPEAPQPPAPTTAAA